MRVQFKMEGGIAFFPGLSKPITIESDQLPRQEANELKRLVNDTHFFELPTTMKPPSRGAADYRQYTITIQDDGKQHTVHLTDPIENSDLQKLITYLKAQRPTAR